MQSHGAAGERKGTGRPLATKTRRAFATHHAHSYGPSLSHGSAAFDALRSLFPSPADLTPPTPSAASRNHSRSPRPRLTSPSSSSSHPTSERPNPFLLEMDPFAHLPPLSDDDKDGEQQQQDEEEEEGDEDEAVEEEAAPEEEVDGEAALTREPFYSTTPSRLSTASSSSSASARSRRTGGRGASMSPAQSRASVSKKLDLAEDDEERGNGEDVEQKQEEGKEEEEVEAKSAEGRRSSRRSTRSIAADDQEEPASSSSSRRRSSAGKEEKVDAEADGEGDAGVADVAMDAEDSKYDGDADEAAADDGGAMDANDDESADEAATDGLHIADDDDGADTEPSTSRVSFSAASSASSASPPKPVAPKRGRAKSRRETTKLVEDAQRLGFLAEGEEEDGEGFGKRGRPRRHRIEPLKYWENEHVEYERTQGGLGNVMPVPRSVVRAKPQSPVKRRGGVAAVKRRPAAAEGRKKPTKVNKQQRKAVAVSDESGSDSEEVDDARPFGGSDVDVEDLAPEQSALVHTHNHEEIHKVVAKTKSRLPLEYLSQPLSSSSTSSPIPLTQLPKGGKAFEEREFSSGVLLLPPLSKKQHEQTCTVESFVILSAAPRSLQVTIGPHGTAFRLSKGDHFVVPLGNVYSLHNLSDSKAVEVYFHLITSKEDVEREVRESMRKEMEDTQHDARGGAAAAGRLQAPRGKPRGARADTDALAVLN